jgi:hypothetical protein
VERTQAERPAPYDWVETLVDRDGFPKGSRGAVVETLAPDALMVELENDTELVLPTYAPHELRVLQRHRY